MVFILQGSLLFPLASLFTSPSSFLLNNVPHNKLTFCSLRKIRGSRHEHIKTISPTHTPSSIFSSIPSVSESSVPSMNLGLDSTSGFGTSFSSHLSVSIFVFFIASCLHSSHLKKKSC